MYLNFYQCHECDHIFNRVNQEQIPDAHCPNCSAKVKATRASFIAAPGSPCSDVGLTICHGHGTIAIYKADDLSLLAVKPGGGPDWFKIMQFLELEFEGQWVDEANPSQVNMDLPPGQN